MFFFFNDTATTEIYTLSLHDALPISLGITIKDKNDVTDALRAAIKAKRPAVLDFRVKRDENVFPMVPAGKSITEMIGGQK